MNLYEDLEYLNRVWEYHEEIASNISERNLGKAARVLSDHMEMIYSR